MTSSINDKKCLLTTSYFPNIWYFIQCISFKDVLIESYENYQKRSYRNRSYISGPNGILLLSIPLVKGKNNQMPISEVQISFDQPWHNQHWNSIQSAYGKTPFFEHYASDIKSLILNANHKTLLILNQIILLTLLDLLNIDASIGLTTNFVETPKNDIYDLRKKNVVQKSITLSKVANLKYMQPFAYKQPFLPNLSILDLLFCKGPESILLLEKASKKLYKEF